MAKSTRTTRDTPFSSAVASFLKYKEAELKDKPGSNPARTVRDYRSHLKVFLAWAAAHRFRKDQARAGGAVRRAEGVEKYMKTLKSGEVTEDMVREFFNQKARAGKSVSTLSVWHYTLKGFYKHLNSHSLGAVADVTAKIPRPRVEKREEVFSFKSAHMKTFMDHVRALPEDNPLLFRDKVLFWTMARFGLTVSEALSLSLKTLKFVGDSLSLTIRGGNKIRILPLPSSVKRADAAGKEHYEPVPGNVEYISLIRRYLEQPEGLSLLKASSKAKSLKTPENIFLSKRGTPLSHDVVRDSFARIMAELKLDEFGYTPHTLRHTIISGWLDAGVDIETASQLSGHGSIASFSSVYSNRKSGKMAEVLAKGL